MSQGRHVTQKRPGDPTFDPNWSGVSYAPTAKGVVCSRCGKHVHAEGEGGDQYYCPYCDDYVHVIPG